MGTCKHTSILEKKKRVSHKGGFRNKNRLNQTLEIFVENNEVSPERTFDDIAVLL